MRERDAMRSETSGGGPGSGLENGGGGGPAPPGVGKDIATGVSGRYGAAPYNSSDRVGPKLSIAL